MSPQKCLLEKKSLHVHQSQCQNLISLLLKSGLSCASHLNGWHWHLSQRTHWQIKGLSLLSSSFFFGCSVQLVGGILVSWPGFEPEGQVLTTGLPGNFHPLCPLYLISGCSLGLETFLPKFTSRPFSPQQCCHRVGCDPIICPSV